MSDLWGPSMFFVTLALIFISGGVRAGGIGAHVRADRSLRRGLRPVLPLRDAGADVRDDVELHAPRGALLHLHGHRAGEEQAGRAAPRDHRSPLRSIPGRIGRRRRHRRSAPGSRDRRGRGERDGDGADFSAGHAPQRLQQGAQPRRDLGVRHPRPDHSAACSSSSATRWASASATCSARRSCPDSC